MRLLLPLMMGWLLLRSGAAMDAAGAACRLFVQSVLPGLFPYMTLSLLLVSRLGTAMPLWLMVTLGWCGGSPTGARLMALRGEKSRRTAVMCATMSPMFLLGTLGSWLQSPGAGACILLSVVLGGYLTGLLVPPGEEKTTAAVQAGPLSFGEAVTAAAHTMLMVCGTMVMLRTLLALVLTVTERMLPALSLPLAALMEVTTACAWLAELPLPLPLRTALTAGAAGMGGAAILLQNRAACPGVMPLWQQALWQGVHGVISFVLALGMMLLWG